MDIAKKLRGARCSAEQYAQMINFVEQNKILVLGKTSLDENKECELKWKELSIILNGLKGATKTSNQWKRTFVEYKSKVKGYARNLLREQRGTGEGTKNIKDLTDTEEKLMSIIGWVSATGDSQLEEPGTPIYTTDKNEENVNNESENTLILLDEIIVTNEISNEIGINEIFEVESPEKEIREKETPVTRKTARRIIHKPKAQNIKINQIRTAANIYEKNSNQLCKSLDNLGTSIHALATANQNIANAMLEAQKNKEK